MPGARAGKTLVWLWQRMHRLYMRGGLSKKVAHIIHYYIHFRYACHISPAAKIEGWVNLPHPLGITVGHGVTIEAGATIYQNVTLGKCADRDGYPHISSGATVFTGAVILGGIRLGRGAQIGANAVVLKSVPDGATAVGVPARILPSVIEAS